MRVIKREIERDKECYYKVTANMEVDLLEPYNFEYRGTDKLDATEDVDSLKKAVLMMAAIDYSAEKELEFEMMINKSGDYFNSYIAQVFYDKHHFLPFEEIEWNDGLGSYEHPVTGAYRYTGYKVVAYEDGLEAYDLELDKSDPFVAKVRIIFDRIMEEFEKVGKSKEQNYRATGFLDELKPLAKEILEEPVEFVAE